MRRFLRRAGIGLGVLLGLLVLSGTVLYAIGSRRVDRTYAVETARLALPTDSAGLARGAHLVRSMGCADCHGENLGGQVLVDEPPFRTVAANLTSGRGGLAARYTAEDFDRSIRHGVKPDGRSVLIMPSAAYHALSDEDAAALIAYLKAAPPVDNELPPSVVRAPGRLMAAVLLDPTSEVRTTPARRGTTPPFGATVEYGEYLATGTCAHCHGSDLRGDPKPPGPPGMPPTPDLVAVAGRWTPAQFSHALRTGETPDGRALDPEVMPWRMTAAMAEDERLAVYAYLRSLASVPGM